MAVGYGKLSRKVVRRAETKGMNVKKRAIVAMGKALKGLQPK